MKKLIYLLLLFPVLILSCNKNIRTALKMPGAIENSTKKQINEKKSNTFSNDFYKICAYGNVKELQKVIKDGASVNEIDNQGYSPLFYAVLGSNPAIFDECVEKIIESIKNDKDEDLYKSLNCIPPVKTNTKVVEFLLKNGANIQLKDRHERTVFIYAALFGNNISILTKLKDAGSNIHQKITIQYPCSLLSLACMTNSNPQVIDFLCKEGGNIDEQNKFGTTPIMWAAMYNSNPEVIDILKKNGADINDPRHKDGYTPLIWSIRCNKNSLITEHLCKLGADICKTDKYTWSAIDWALLNSPSFKWSEKFDKIQNKIADYNSLTEIKQLIELKEEGKAEHLKAILKYCNDDKIKKAALFGACFSSDENFYSLVNSIKDFDVDTKGLFTLLIPFDDVEKLKLINKKLKNLNNKTLSLEFYYAVLSNSLNIAKYLCSEIKEMEIEWQSAIVSNCTDTEILNIFCKAPFINLYQKDDYGKTLLYIACEKQNSIAAQTLIYQGADVNTTCSTQKSRTPLISQCYKKSPDSKIVNLLIKNGARINAKDEDGVSALIAACYSNLNDNAIKILINSGADTKEQYKGYYVYEYCNSTIQTYYPKTYKTLYNEINSSYRNY